MILNTVKPQLSGHFGTFPSVRLTEVVKIAFLFLTINIQRLLCAVIKFHVVKKAIQSLSSLSFITNFNLFVNAKALTQGPKVGMAGVLEPVSSVVFVVMVSCKLSSRRFRNFIICHKLCVLLFKLLFGTVLDSALYRSRLSKLRLKNGVCGCKIVWSCLVVHPVRNSAWSLCVLPDYRTCK